CRMRDGGARVAEIRRDRDHLRRVDQPPRRLASPFHLERNDAAESRLLALRERVLRMVDEAGIENARDLRLLREPLGERLRLLAVRLHAQLQRLQSLEEHPRIERAHARARGAQEAEDLLADALGVADDRPADAAALPV